MATEVFNPVRVGRDGIKRFTIPSRSITFQANSHADHLQDVQALLEAESGVPIPEQAISLEGRELNQPSATMRGLGVADNAMLLLKRRAAAVAGGREVPQDAEMMRLQLLGNPDLLRQLRQTQPELVDAAENSPARFAALMRQMHERQREAEIARQREIEALNADPYDIEAQRRIEEAIRQEAIMENLEHALEYSPEAFGRVTML
ncbi:hypothetical protein OG21DRAFT_972178 [Imleria badia]|nr:hypothetical protein OG21DRAFT_972178 [Imleria badia]